METITATYDVVTPMFLGGANHAPELRLASYVDALRWWWRFLALGRYGSADRAGFWEATLFGWHKPPFGRKRVLFRLLPDEATSGLPAPWEQKDFELKRHGKKDVFVASDAFGNWSGIGYLSGQAFSPPANTPYVENAQGIVREPVPVTRFSVEMRLLPSQVGQDLPAAWTVVYRIGRNTTSLAKAAADIYAKSTCDTESRTDFAAEWQLARNILVDAVLAVGLMGGLGSRSRRGFGSLAIRGLCHNGYQQIPETLAEYRSRITEIFAKGSAFSSTPPYSALSRDAQYFITSGKATPRDDIRSLMNRVGAAFQVFRSYGHKDRDQKHVHQPTAGQNKSRPIAAGAGKREFYDPRFFKDHDEFYKNIKNNMDNIVEPVNSEKDSPHILNRVPHRVVFGLPHSYGQNTTVGWITGEEIEEKKKVERRRASPLFFHFHSFDNGEVTALAFVIPSKFLPGKSEFSANIYKTHYNTNINDGGKYCNGITMKIDGTEIPNIEILFNFIDYLRNPTVGDYDWTKFP